MAKLLKTLEYPTDGDDPWAQLHEGQSLLGGSHGRIGDFDEDTSEVVVRDSGGKELVRSRIELPANPEWRRYEFDRSGATAWLARGGAEDTRLYAVDVATGRVATQKLGWAETIWLLPDWDSDRAMLVDTHDDCCISLAVEHTLTPDAQLVRKPWVRLEAPPRGPNSDAVAVHYRGGRIIAVGHRNFLLFEPGSSVPSVGPPTPDGDCYFFFASAPDRFVFGTRMHLWVYDAATLTELAVVRTPDYLLEPTVELLAGDRFIVMRGSPLSVRGVPGAYLCELWQI